MMTATVGYKHPEVAWNGLTVTDLFCGAGGSSSGLVEAGYRVVIAANHWALAIESHQMNHPDTDHSQADISQVDPRYFPRTHVLWGSPECTNHSIAKGIKRQRQQDLALFELDGTAPLPDEAANRSRATMWDIPRFAEHHRYMAIILENVVDAYRWDQFPAWQLAMEKLGYRMQFAWLNSMHAQIGGLPAPQSRDRMYIVMWREDLAKKKKGLTGPNVAKWTSPMAVCLEHGEIQAVQAFKKTEQWGRYRAQYLYRCPKCWQVVEPGWLSAASIIDWSLPVTRIGDKPLKEFWADKKKTVSLGFHHMAPKTLRRGQLGIERYWAPVVMEAAGNAYDSTDPRHPQFGQRGGYVRAWPTGEPLRTLHGTASKALMVPPEPLVMNIVSGADESRVRPTSSPLPALVAGGTHAALLVPVEGREGKHASPVSAPFRTQSTRNETALIVPLRNHGVAKPTSQPIDTVSAEGNHHALLMRNNEGGAEMLTPVQEPMRTLTTGGHQSLVTPADPVSMDILDAGFRMLEPHEIQAGMGFAPDYLLLGSKRDKVKQAGNAVTPPAARDLGHAVAEFLLAVAS